MLTNLDESLYNHNFAALIVAWYEEEISKSEDNGSSEGGSMQIASTHIRCVYCGQTIPRETPYCPICQKKFLFKGLGL